LVFDQRGVGLSRPALDCPEFTEVTLDLLDEQVAGQMVDDQQAADLILGSVRTCRDRLSQVADLSLYNSTASAHDVDLLRQAFGFQEVNLWGASYGTRLGLEVLRLHPEALRSVTLEAVYPPDVDLMAAVSGNFSRSLELLFDHCTANPVCSQSYPDLRAVFFSTLAYLDANPAAILLMDPFTGEEYPARMDGSTLLAIVFQVLYDSDLRYLLPKMIYAASQGDFTVFEHLRSSMISLMKLTSRGMMFSVQCHEEVPFSSPRLVQEELARHPELESMYRNNPQGTLNFDICQAWEIEPAGPSANQPVISDRPVLILNGEFDPITPPAWGMQAAETLPNAYTFTYPGIGHGATGVDDCPAGMFTAFLLDPTRPPDAACIAGMER
jgi:pimeloyl-ACP methyl ester carboxylesterase